MNNKWIKPLLLLSAIVIVFSTLARLLGRGETLLEYAALHPEKAYASPKTPGDDFEATDDGIEAFPSEMPSSASGTGVSPSGMSLPASGAEVSPSKTPLPASGTQASPAKQGADDPSFSENASTQEEFFYQPLTAEIIARIRGISYPVSESDAPTLSLGAVNVVPDDEVLAVSYDDLRYMNVLYYDFDGKPQTGELICNKGIAQDLLEIFYELYQNEYQIEKIRLIDQYGGDDTASMEDNNTSCFNYRLVEGTDSLSKHALGCAIDINPFYNPYVVFNKGGNGDTYISPEGSEIYADRSGDFPYKIDENDLCYKLFKAHGFTWGGDWNSSKDYQHFQKIPNQ